MDDRVAVRLTAVRDARVSFRAKGVLMFLLAAGRGEDLTLDSIAAAATEDPTEVAEALQELIDSGYLARERSSGGELGESAWTITDTPDQPETP
ncbi:hypothetical protein [Nocardia araoensis]|uniref:hypothetical protein n=1 Tax=Nocardia araoensis TaxID=228600 RepID=UPI0002DC2927|nr:hypothetical protein [Nocardia araoensis]